MADLLLEYQEVPAEMFAEAELFMASSRATEKDGLVWVEATRTGVSKVNPIRGAKGPLVIDEPMIDSMIRNFEAGAWEHVTLPLADEDDDKVHKDLTKSNTGTVQKLRKGKRADDGAIVLLAGCDITEPDVRSKVLNRSILGRSVGASLDGVLDVESGKRFEGAVLKHVAWTNKPWIRKLAPGAVDPENYLAASIVEDEKAVETDEILKQMVDDEDIGTEDADEVLEDEELVAMPKKVVHAALLALAAQSNEATTGKMPSSANYRVASDKAQCCGNCTHFDRNSTNKASGYDMGECTLYSAPAQANHVSNGFEARSTKHKPMSMDMAKKDRPVIRLVSK